MVPSEETARACWLTPKRYKLLRATVGNYPDPVNWRCGVCSRGTSTSRNFLLLSTRAGPHRHILYGGQVFAPPILIIYPVKAN